MSMQNIIDCIGKDYHFQSVSMTDYPTTHLYPQIIQGLVRSIISAMSPLKDCVESGAYELIESRLWFCGIHEGQQIITEIGNLKLSDKVKTDNMHNINDIWEAQIDGVNNDNKKTFGAIKDAKKNLDTVVNSVFETIKAIWQIIQSVYGINFPETEPTIKQIFTWSSLLSGYIQISQDKGKSSLQWDVLCDKIETCICKDNGKKSQIWFVTIAFVILIFVLCFIYGFTYYNGVYWESLLLAFVFMSSIVTFSALALYKFIQFLNLQCERNTKMKEKIIDKVINAFNEDRENAMLHTKTELSLHEKKEKACLEEWERDKEHVRKMNILEHDRKAKLNDVLIELAKIQNKTTKINSQKKEQPSKDTPEEKTINEESILPILLNLK